MTSVPKLEILYKYTTYSAEKGRSTVSQFCRKYYPSKRRKTISKIIREARGNIILGPWLFTLQSVSVDLIPYQNVPVLDVLEEKKRDDSVFNSVVLVGSFSMITFRRTKEEPDTSTKLRYAESIIPKLSVTGNAGGIDPSIHEPEKLPEMHKPVRWDDMDWGIYYKMNDPNESSSRVASELHISYKTVLNRFYRVQKDCTIWMCFFPRGYEYYKQFLVTLETDYEVGFRKELQKLDRSSYVYKIGDLLLLHLFLDKSTDLCFLLDLEKRGVIHSLSVSVPLKYYNRFQQSGRSAI